MVNPNVHLALSRARQEELIHEAQRRSRASGNERPGALARLAAHLRRRPARRAAPASS